MRGGSIEISEYLQKLVRDGIIAVVAAWFAVRMSLRKFSSEKWWERRERAYSEIVKSLSSILLWLGKWENDVLGLSRLSEEKREEIWARFHEERDSIEHAARSGSFVATKNISQALLKLRHELHKEDRSGDMMKDIHNYWVAVEECLKLVETEAKKDLGLDRKWYRMWP